MSHIRKHLQKEHFEDISSGRKTVECRLKKGDFASLQIGDNITFHNDDGNEVVVSVLELIPYNSFEECLDEHLTSTLPRVSNKNEGVSIYLKPTGIYNKDDENRYKIIAIRFVKIEGYLTPKIGKLRNF